MKFGVLIIPSRTTWDEIRTSIETMEAGRWNSLWFTDHLMYSFHRSKNKKEEEQLPIFDGYTTLAVAAGMTKRLKLGHLVLGNSYRNPALVAKMATHWCHVAPYSTSLHQEAARNVQDRPLTARQTQLRPTL